MFFRLSTRCVTALLVSLRAASKPMKSESGRSRNSACIVFLVSVHTPALEELDVVDVAGVPNAGSFFKLRKRLPLVRAEILEARLDHQRHDLWRDRTLRGPDAARLPAEGLFVQLLRQAQVGAHILRCGKSRGQGRLRLAAARDVGVEHQRHDRMKIRRRCQLDLPAVLRRAIFRQNDLEDFTVDIEQLDFFLFGESPALVAQRLDLRKAARGGKAGPLQIVKHLQVAKIILAERLHDAVELGQRVARPRAWPATRRSAGRGESACPS